MIPKQISYKDVIKAIRVVGQKGHPERRKSKTWDLHFEGELYPPKYIISKAAEFSSYGKFFYHDEFDSGDARIYLNKLKFTVLLRDEFSNVVVLEDLIPEAPNTVSKKDLQAALKRLSKLPPERKSRIVEQSNRGDTPLIKLVRSLYNYQCQMPGCKANIKKKNGELYCEVAHIEPFSKTKSSKPENLIVLCPNHHKEFDLGDCKITSRQKKSVSGTLNGRKFHFVLKY